MRLGAPSPRGGFALIIVLTIIFVLAILAGGFAYSMKVESRLAANANSESELEWMGRSGVELARYVLDQSQRSGARYTSLNQIWAGGPGDAQETNSPLAGINLREWPLGPGVIGIQIVDLERKLNLNRLATLPPGQEGGQSLLTRALEVVGVQALDASVVADSILDWRDVDDATHISGTETDFYRGLDPAYFAKNGPFDDLAELLLVNGVTPELYWGPRAAGHQTQWADPRKTRRGRSRNRDLMPAYPVGLVDLFVPLSSGAVNINTAGIHVLQVALGITDDLAANVIRARSGLDGAEGTEDDTPFTSTALGMVPGLETMQPGMRAPLTTVSSYFEVTVDVRLGRSRRQCVAILGRGIGGIPSALAGEGNVRVLQYSWR